MVSGKVIDVLFLDLLLVDFELDYVYFDVVLVVIDWG